MSTPDIASVIRTAVFGILFGMTEVPLMAQCAPIVAQVSGEFDCAYGGTVRWNGLFFTGGFAITSPCGGAMNYSLLSFSDPGYNSSGLVTEDWVQESMTSWRYLTSLPAGGYSLAIWPSNTVPMPQVPQCSQSLGICVTACPTGGVCYAPAGSLIIPSDPGNCGVNVQVRAWLDGALPSGTLMNDGLRAAGLIPFAEPFSALGYAYTGAVPGATIQSSLLAVTGNDAVVDWVILELRSSTTAVVWSKPALLRRNGYVMDLDGDASVFFPVPPGNYRLVIRHRNHLPVMTAQPYSLSLTPALVDLGNGATSVYGTNARIQKGTIHCLWSGDATGNGTIAYIGANNDRDPILTAIGGTTPNNTLGPVYDRRDVNMDGVIRYVGANNDRDPILTNVGSTTPNNTRTQQLP
ncbi:MAG: hypothetical protein IPO90_10690 [Flavobacteriales bacterium]|nr:hypothetical protein [Flavobacteriales bacterium]